MRKLLTMLVAALLLATVLIPAVSLAAETRYIFTKNGRGLNIRTDPIVADNIITSVGYGKAVTVQYDLGNGWTAISWDAPYDIAYVQSRYLVTSKPAPYKPSESSTTPSSTKDATTVEQINTLLKKVTYVTPYEITVRPTRASGWVYMRWVPSKHSSSVATYSNGATLQVIAEFSDWYQVVDPDDGKTGFIFKSYVK